MPLVTVIIPNYNHEKYLRQRIVSVLNQTFNDFEVIILDDFSTDGSREIIEEFRGHAKISQIIYNATNSGSTFKQWKKGIELAKGEYIWIAESDDRSGDTFLETVLKPTRNSQEVLISYCQSWVIDSFDNELYVTEWSDVLDRRKWKQDYIEDSAYELNNFLKYRNTIPNASAVLFKKPSIAIFNEVEKMRFIGDWLFYKELLDTPGKIAFSASPLNYFRLHADTTRNLGDISKAKRRMHELRFFVEVKPFDFFEYRYDWIIIVWYENRPALKGSFYYYIPDLPFPLIVRTYWIGLKKGIARLSKIFKSAPSNN